MKKGTWKVCAGWILFTEAVGALSGWLTREGTRIYKAETVKPPLSPPSIVFPIVWALLFALMGIGVARISGTPPSRDRSRGMRLFFAQLGFNFFWSILFFSLQSYGLAFFWLAALWGADPVDDPGLPQGGPTGRVDAGPLPPLGDLRGVSESGRLAAEPVGV